MTPSAAAPSVRVVPSLPVRWALLALAGYKKYLSPLLPPSCRFSPTCSEYAALVIRQRGLLIGSWLAAVRVFRCQPLSAGGVDLPAGCRPVDPNDRIGTRS